MQQLDSLNTSAANEDPLVDSVVLLSGYAWRAFRRRLGTALACFMITVGLTAGFLALSSPLYRVETRILATTPDVVPALAAQPGAVRPDKDPSAAAAELVKSRDNFTGVIEELRLLERWEQTRTPTGRLVDRLVAILTGPRSTAALREGVLGVLGKRVSARMEGGLITIAVDWHEPQGALDIARALNTRFLATLQRNEADQIKEAVSILGRDLAQADGQLAQALRAFQLAAENANSQNGRAFKVPRGPVPDLEQVARLQSDLGRKREALSRLEAAYESRIATAESSLNALRSALGPSHPDVTAAERNLHLQQQVPQNLAVARAEEDRLSTELNRVAPQATAAGLLQALAQVAVVDPTLETARDNYRRASDEHTRIAELLATARTQLATATSAFPYRFVMTQPPQAPREPAQPRTIPILVAGLLAATFLAFVVAVLSEIVSGRIHESWQILRFVGVPVLGHIGTRRA